MRHAEPSDPPRRRPRRPRARALRALPPAGTARAVRSAVLAVLPLAALAGCGGSTDDDAARADLTEAAVEAPVSVADDEPVDLDAFVAVDSPTWLAIHEAPEASAGERVVVFAYVTRTFAAQAGTVQVQVSTAHPASDAEGTPAVLRADPAALAGAQIGTVLRVHAEVAGAYAGVTGGSVRIPELVVAAVEDVGPYDPTVDVTLDDVDRASGKASVTFTTRNSGDVVLTYVVELTATGADGLVQSVTWPQLPSLAPGESVTAEAWLDPAAADATIAVTDVTRFPPVVP